MITKNIYKLLPKTSYSLRLNKGIRKLTKLRRFNFFILKYRQLLHKYYCDMKYKASSNIHKRSFKKKNKLSLSNYLCYLDLKISGILYHSFLVPKINLLKQYLLHGLIMVNDKKVTNYAFKINALDIVSINCFFNNKFFMVNKLLKHPILNKFAYLKEFSLLIFNIKRRYFINTNFSNNEYFKYNLVKEGRYFLEKKRFKKFNNMYLYYSLLKLIEGV